MAKPKLLLVLGAGSSVGQGMPSVAGLNHEMLQWAADWVRTYSPMTVFYERLWGNAATCFNLEPKATLRRTPNLKKGAGRYRFECAEGDPGT